MINPINISSLLDIEDQVKEQSLKKIGVGYSNFQEYIDLLFKLCYFTGHKVKVENDEVFEYFCVSNYYQAPYTFNIIIDLMIKGHYLECMILNRHILEAIVKMSYFFIDSTKLSAHVLLKKDGRVHFSKMFDKLGLNMLYNKLYQNLSDSAHGIIFKNHFRYDNGEVILGTKFSMDKVTIILNDFYLLLFAYINKFKIFFKNNTIRNEHDFLLLYSNTCNLLEESIMRHREMNEVKWYFDEMLKLAR